LPNVLKLLERLRIYLSPSLEMIVSLHSRVTPHGQFQLALQESGLFSWVAVAVAVEMAVAVAVAAADSLKPLLSLQALSPT
jgi:hypothetical protein